MNAAFFVETENEICEDCESKDENLLKEVASKLDNKKEDVLGKADELSLKNISISKQNGSLVKSIIKDRKIVDAPKFKGMLK